MERNNMVYILRGLPGSGKSQLASKIATECSSVSGQPYGVRICSADYFFLRADGSYKFDKRLVGRSHAECLASFLDGLSKGFANLIVDNTNSQRWEYSNYETLAKLYGYDIKIVAIKCTNQHTAMAFHQRNVHGVPESAHVNMWQRWEVDPRATVIKPWLPGQHLNLPRRAMPPSFLSVPLSRSFEHSEDDTASDSDHSRGNSRGSSRVNSRVNSRSVSPYTSRVHSRAHSPHRGTVDWSFTIPSSGTSTPVSPLPIGQQRMVQSDSPEFGRDYFTGFQQKLDNLSLSLADNLNIADDATLEQRTKAEKPAVTDRGQSTPYGNASWTAPLR